MELGQVATGRRRIIDITGGTVEGPGFKGKVRNGGADWQIVRADGFTELDTRYTIETDKGQLIYVQNPGMRHAPPDVMKKLLAGEAVDPALVYFRTHAEVRNLGTRAAVDDPRDLRRRGRALSLRSGDPLLPRGIE